MSGKHAGRIFICALTKEALKSSPYLMFTYVSKYKYHVLFFSGNRSDVLGGQLAAHSNESCSGPPQIKQRLGLSTSYVLWAMIADKRIVSFAETQFPH